MDKNINNPHDKFLKALLNDIYVAKQYIATILPEEILTKIDIDSLQHGNTGFVMEDLKEVFSDMVFKCKLKEGNNAYLSLVLEHKSTPDKYTFIQILLYVAYGYYQQYKSGKKIHPIIPVILYHGKTKWKIKTIVELIDELPENLEKYIPQFKSVFVDLVNFSDEQLNSLGDSLLTSALLLQKYAANPQELQNKLNMIYSKLDSVRDRNLLRIMIVYSLQIVKIETIQKAIMSVSPNIKNEVMTAYDTLIQEGRQEGRQEGAWQKNIEVIVTGYKNGIGIDKLAIITGLDIEQVKEIIVKHKGN